MMGVCYWRMNPYLTAKLGAGEKQAGVCPTDVEYISISKSARRAQPTQSQLSKRCHPSLLQEFLV
jgi:hypothetical protein